jgi:hypothetical protein
MTVLNAVRPPHPHPYFYESLIVEGVTDQEIWSIVCIYWENCVKSITKTITDRLEKNGVSHDLAPRIAASFVSKLMAINGSIPTSVQTFTTVKEKVNALLSGNSLEELIGVDCELSCRETCVCILLEDINEYVQFTRDYMQVCIEPIEMRIGGKVVEYTVPIFRVSSPYSIHKSVLSQYCILNPSRRLKDKFKSVLLNECGRFRENKCLTYTGQVKYIEKAFHILVHKFFDKSGISITDPVKIRSPLLSNIKYSKDTLTNFDDIDAVLGNILSFLSGSYLVL